MRCACGHDNPSAAKFCGECGARLSLTCAACGAPNPPGNRYCHACGSGLADAGGERPASPPAHLAEKILSARPALEGERKLVTVLFADLKSSMELLAARDPEDARSLLDPVLERMIEAVHHYEGTVNQVMGDGIMALFGAPVAHEDHVVRACYAALRMQESVKRYAAELERTERVPVRIRVGLNTGEVVVRAIDNDLHMDYTAVGQTTHLAARMEQMATPGSILVTADVARAVEGFVELRGLGAVRVKGLAEPVEVHEVTGAVPGRSRLEAAAVRGLTPFVGREAELGALLAALAGAIARHGRLVGVTGEPGMGKSRLLWEFRRSEPARACRFLEIRPPGYARAHDHAAVSVLLRDYFGAAAGEDARVVRDRVAVRIAELDPDLKTSLPALLTLVHVAPADPDWQALDAGERTRRMSDALARLLVRQSEREPLVLVVEDLQWIDAETAGLLDGLVEAVASARLLVIATYRPEYRPAWKDAAHATEVTLRPLPEEGAHAVLDALLGEGASPVKQLLIERTGSNPFFLEECVRHLRETGALTSGATGSRVDAVALDVPATVHAVLAARIDRLPAGLKQLLQTAAVVGSDVGWPLLAAVGDLPEDELRIGLDRLQETGFIQPVQLFPELQYAFKHALTHDVAYASLLQQRRRALHARIVTAIEALHARDLGEHVERLAHHARRGELWDKAVDYLRRSASRAMLGSANQDAAERLRQASSALEHLPPGPHVTQQAIDVRLELRAPLLQLGALEEAHAVSREAERLAQALGDDERLVRVYTYLINHHYLRGAPDLAIEYGERCLRIGELVKDPAIQVARRYMAQSYHAQGRYRQAAEVFAQGLESLEAGHGWEDDPQATTAYVATGGWLAFTLAEIGDFAGAHRALGRVERVAERGHAYSRAIAATLTGLVWLRQGDLGRARPPLEASVGTCVEKGLRVWQPIASSLLGLARVRAGQPVDGLPLLEDGVRMSTELGVRAYLGLWMTHLAEGLLAAGDRDRALGVAQEALHCAIACKERGHQGYAARVLGDIAASGDRPDLDAAEARFTEARVLAEELGMRPLLTHCYAALAEVYHRTGKPSKARTLLGMSHALFGALAMGAWAEQTERALRALPPARREDAERTLLIVARDHPRLYADLVRQLAGEAIEVILDRRDGEGKETTVAPEPGSRPPERRSRPHIDAQLRSFGWSMLP